MRIGAVCFLACLFGLTRLCYSERPPNVLVIIGDDHAAYVYGAYGNAKAATPNLDRFAQTAMRFDRAYCNSPVCTASRQSFLTGRAPHSIGVTLLPTALDDEPLTLAELFKGAGYATAAIGKMHFNSAKSHGFDQLLDIGKPQSALGLTESFDFKTQPPWKPFKDHARIWLNSENLPQAAHREEMPGSILAERAIEFMKEHAATPFLLFASFHEPHSPFNYPVEYRGRFNPADFEVPEVGSEDDAQIPAIFRDLTPTEKQGIIAAYYTSTAFLDECVGKVLKGLDETGLTTNTVVVYLGDHGYSLGQHGRFEKHCHYEPAVRVPLLIRWPEHTRGGSSADALVELMDVFPTLATICGLDIPAEVEGKTLIPILTGESKTHRQAVFSEYLENEEAMIRDERFKLIYSTGHRERKDGYATDKDSPRPWIRLFDLKNDPGETRNLAGLPQFAARVEEMKKTMIGRLSSRPDFQTEQSATPDEQLLRYLKPPDENLKKQ